MTGIQSLSSRPGLGPAAEEELTSPGTSVTVWELAARCGFADSSHFTRVFKKKYGHSPARLARLDHHGLRP